MMGEREADPLPSTEPKDPAATAKKQRLTCLSCGLLAILVPVVLLIVVSLPVVWLPDVILPSRWIHVDGVALPNGQELHLFQRWSYDFYLTAVACKEKGRYVKVFYVDGDDWRRWRWDVRLDPMKQMATISLDGHDFTYHWPDGAFRSVEDLIGVYTYHEIDLKQELLDRPGDWDRLSK